MAKQSLQRKGKQKRTKNVDEQSEASDIQEKSSAGRKRKLNLTSEASKPKRGRVEQSEPVAGTSSSFSEYKYSSESGSDADSDSEWESVSNGSSEDSESESDGANQQPNIPSKPYRIKKKAYQVQYQFNNSILKEIDAATSSLKPKHKQARAALGKARSLILYRQKILRIADKCGWDAVKEYEASGIGENDNDEKKIKKAIRTAEKKREAVATHRVRRRRPPLLPFPNGESPGFKSYIQPLFTARLPAFQNQTQVYGNPRSTSSKTMSSGIGKMPVKIRKLQSYCYTCGLAGHWSGDPECRGGQFRGYF